MTQPRLAALVSACAIFVAACGGGAPSSDLLVPVGGEAVGDSASDVGGDAGQIDAAGSDGPDTEVGSGMSSQNDGDPTDGVAEDGATGGAGDECAGDESCTRDERVPVDTDAAVGPTLEPLIECVLEELKAGELTEEDCPDLVDSDLGECPGCEEPTAAPDPPPAPTPTPTPIPGGANTNPNPPGPTASPAPTAGPAGIWSPAPGTPWQWQLTGDVDTSVDVAVYDIDLFDVSAATIADLHGAGRTVICYFSAGAWENWRPDADGFPNSVLGRQNGWPGERWLDVRALDTLAPIIEARLDLAVSKGCDAVEPDNVDGYQNQSGFAITASDQIAFNTYLAEQAHTRGLSIGLKNAVELVGILEPHFDWALNEECARYNECDALTPFIDANKAVFHVEYRGDGNFCTEALALGFSSLEKDLDVGPVFDPC